MKYILILTAFLLMVLTGCGSKSKQDSITFSPDTIIAETSPSLDTATALPDEEPAPPVVKKNIDSLATATEALEFMMNSDDWEKYKEGIIPSVLEQNVDYGRRLINNRFEHFIIVDKQSMHVILYDKYGREVKSYLMACSRRYGTKHQRRDNRTPEGFFTAGSTYDSTDWLYTDDDGKTSPAKGQFGPRFIRVKNPVSSQIGIHGTAARYSPGRRASHGCIRLLNEHILDLVEYVHAGMPIIVNPSDRDQQVNREEGYDDIVQLKIGKPIHVTAREEEKKDSTASTKADSAAVNTDISNDTVPTADEPADKPSPSQPEEPETTDDSEE